MASTFSSSNTAGWFNPAFSAGSSLSTVFVSLTKQASHPITTTTVSGTTSLTTVTDTSKFSTAQPTARAIGGIQPGIFWTVIGVVAAIILVGGLLFWYFHQRNRRRRELEREEDRVRHQEFMDRLVQGRIPRVTTAQSVSGRTITSERSAPRSWRDLGDRFLGPSAARVPQRHGVLRARENPNQLVETELARRTEANTQGNRGQDRNSVGVDFGDSTASAGEEFDMVQRDPSLHPRLQALQDEGWHPDSTDIGDSSVASNPDVPLYTSPRPTTSRELNPSWYPSQIVPRRPTPQQESSTIAASGHFWEENGTRTDSRGVSWITDDGNDPNVMDSINMGTLSGSTVTAHSGATSGLSGTTAAEGPRLNYSPHKNNERYLNDGTFRRGRDTGR
jgi:hypothetical protein